MIQKIIITCLFSILIPFSIFAENKPVTSQQLSLSNGTSPGVTIGQTWVDMQKTNNMGRMIDWGPYAENVFDNTHRVHFTFYRNEQPLDSVGTFLYTLFNANTGVFQSTTYMNVKSIGLNLEVTPDGKAVIGGNGIDYEIIPSSGTDMAAVTFDFAPGFFFFNNVAELDDLTASYGIGEPGEVEMICPSIQYQISNDSVLHLLAVEKNVVKGAPITLGYYRSINAERAPVEWDYPPYIIDTIYNKAYEIIASRQSDRVAMVWTANLPNAGDCDTCSGISPYYPEYDNDIYYQISSDKSLTWLPRVNLTGYDENSPYRAFGDFSILFDSEDHLHILFTAIPALDNSYLEVLGTQSKLFHWSEDRPYIRTVAFADWDLPNCSAGANRLNISKVQLSECNGNLYALWVQFDDPPHDIFNDCSDEGYANGDLMLSISDDNGLTWSPAYNLTQTQSPGCLSGDCLSENWPTMTRYGYENQPEENWSMAITIDPTDTYGGTYYLDIQYIADEDAGAVLEDEGDWQLDDVKWFRLACVDPPSIPCCPPSFAGIDYPAFTPPGIQLDTSFIWENYSSVPITYSITIEEDNGPSGWLDITPTSETILSGLNNTQEFIINLNKNGVQTTPWMLEGRFIIFSNLPSSPDTIPIHLYVVDNVYNPYIDTIHSGCLSLAVSSDGSFGNRGDGSVNLDWQYSTLECDPTADVYLYDGSPVIGWIDGEDTVMNWSVYGTSFLHDNGLVPLGDSYECEIPYTNIFSTGTILTHDSTLMLEKIYYTPKDMDSCDFIIEALRVKSYDGASHSGIIIGEVFDWDIPSDSVVDWDDPISRSVKNRADFHIIPDVIYQQGYESSDTNHDGSPECQDNDTRFGGVSFIESYRNGFIDHDQLFKAYAADNSLYVDPTGNFVASELYEQMTTGSGYYDGTEVENYHIGICMDPSLYLSPYDEYIAFNILATVRNGSVSDLLDLIDKATTWYTNHDIARTLIDNLQCYTCCLPSFAGIDYPVFTPPGIQLDTSFTWENSGTASLDYSITIEEDNGPSGWLDISPVSGSILSGMSNTEVFTINLNKNGVQTTPAMLEGRFIINSNLPSSPDTIPIHLYVVDNVYNPYIDTIHSGCLNLAVSNDGSFGDRGDGSVNLDWQYSTLECDPLADVYLYDGSPVIGWIDGVDTVMNWSVYGTSFLHDNGLVPLGGSYECEISYTSIFSTGTILTHDSTLMLEKIYYAPKNTDSCDFIIEALRVKSFDGASHDGIVVGEVIDWDIPSDSVVDWDDPVNRSVMNWAGFHVIMPEVIYQKGYEGYDTNPDGSPECQDNDTRFGGISFIESYLNGVQYKDQLYSAYAADNDLYVDPIGNLDAPELYEQMTRNGYYYGEGVKNYHIGICMEASLDLGATDEYIAFNILATVRNGSVSDLLSLIDKATTWFTNHDIAGNLLDNLQCNTCCKIRGDVNLDNSVDVGDIVDMVTYQFLSGEEPDCMEATDINGDGYIDIGDIVCFVEYQFYVPIECFPVPCDN